MEIWFKASVVVRIGNATPLAVHQLHYCSHKAGKNYDKKISIGVQKRGTVVCKLEL